MRNLIYLVVLTFMILSCEREGGYNIRLSSLDNIEDSVSLYIYEPANNKVRKINEGIISSDDALVFRGINDTVEHLAYLKFRKDSSAYYFILDNVPVEFQLFNGDLRLLRGSDANNDLYERIVKLDSLETIKDSLTITYNRMLADTMLTSLYENAILREYNEVKDSLQNTLMNVMTDSGFHTYIIWRRFGHLMHPDSVLKIKNKADYIK